MMDANTRGITIICISDKKIWPGNASQLPISIAVAGVTQPVDGPMIMPNEMPSTIPIKT